MLEPGVGEDAVQAPKDVNEVLQYRALIVAFRNKNESAREYLRIGDDVCGPVERVAAVIDGAATLGLFVDGAQELPFGGAHLGTCGGRTWWGVEEKSYYEAVALSD